MIRHLDIADCRALVTTINELPTSELIEQVRFFLRDALSGTPVEPMLDALFDDPSWLENSWISVEIEISVLRMSTVVDKSGCSDRFRAL